MGRSPPGTNIPPACRLTALGMVNSFGFGGSHCSLAMLMLRRGEGRPVLFVTADEPVPPPFTAFRDEPLAAYALALLRVPGGDVAFRPAAGGDEVRHREWPPALEFLRWLRLGGSSVTLGADAGQWTWTRTG